jgi:hypothetical protein
MAKRKAPELSQKAQAANAAGEAKREKEKQARQRNAEKQQRFRDSMKAEGYRRVTLWDLPSPAGKRLFSQGFRQVPAWELPEKSPGKTRAAKVTFAVRIRESSLHAGDRSPKVQEALQRAAGELAASLSRTPEGRAVYSDYLELVALIGDPRGEE